MKDVTITYDLPTKLTDGADLAKSDIRYVRADLSADAGENWSEIERVPPEMEQKVEVPDMEKGEWAVALTVVLIDGRESAAKMVTFTVPSDAPPEEVSNVNVTME